MSVGWSSLRLWVELSQHEREKNNMADEYARVRITQRWFLALSVVAKQRALERRKRALADQHFF